MASWSLCSTWAVRLWQPSSAAAGGATKTNPAASVARVSNLLMNRFVFASILIVFCVLTSSRLVVMDHARKPEHDPVCHRRAALGLMFGRSRIQRRDHFVG